MKKFGIGASIITFVFVSIFVTSCIIEVNSIGDPHFNNDGAPQDSSLTFFTPVRPESVKLYIETSGSMNGFFRANKPTNFKKTVWSVFSGLSHRTDGKVYTMSNGGDIDTPVALTDFRTKMNAGKFVSNSSTHIPAMLLNILQNIDTAKSEVAVLVSDMKYSPTGISAATDLLQYQEQIRNLVALFPKLSFSFSFVCATSEYLNNNGTVAEQKSPYIFLIIGKSDNVAAIRNDISRWCEATGAYVESGDMGMDYHTPSYEIKDVKNGVLSKLYPKNLITDYDSSVSDTCSFIYRVNMTGFPWSAVDPKVLKDALNVKTVYGSLVDVELLTEDGHLVDNHAWEGEFERCSYADYLVKLYNFGLADEVLEIKFSNKPIDGCYFVEFNNMITTDNEKNLSGLFSFNKFLEGVFNAKLNTSDKEPVRILVSSYQD